MTRTSVHHDATYTLAELQRHCLLVHVTFHRWSGRALVRDAEVELDKTPLDGSQVTPPRWRLVPQNLKRPVDRIQSRARAALTRVSVPFPLKGVHVVPIERAPELFQELRKLRAELETTLDRIVLQGYGDLVDEIRTRLGPDVFAKAQEHVPNAETMHRRFGIEWSVFALEMRPATAGASVIPFLREAEAQFARTVSAAMERLVRGPREELAAALANFAARLEGGGRTKTGTLEQVRRAYGKVRAFRFLADDKILETIDGLDRRIGKLTPREVNSADEWWAGETVELLRKAAAVATDERAIGIALRRSRGLRVPKRAPAPERDPEPVAP